MELGILKLNKIDIGSPRFVIHSKTENKILKEINIEGKQTLAYMQLNDPKKDLYDSMMKVKGLSARKDLYFSGISDTG